MVLMGVLSGGVFWLYTKAIAPALYVGAYIALFGVAMSGALVLSRLICGTATDKLLTLHRSVKGDWSFTIGFFVSVGLAGYLAERLAQARDAGEAQPAVGLAMDIASPTLDGGRFDLAEHRGKVVLVDFWATWCGPCIAELPNVRAVYDKYHGDGFEVVAVSLDFERARLDKFLEAHPEPWPQIFFDEEGKRGFDNPLAQRCGVQGIPYLLVIDRDGKLVASDVRGRQIDAAVAEALGRPVSWGDRLATAGRRLLDWLINGVLKSPWWLLLLCGLGGTVVLASAKAAVRRALQGPVIQAASG
ncbi:MAG TPA: TlpA disulfide reductase family protein [Fimbriiglobus sp.]|nr:TlpA disulfide reductase family protein [Fimbriiglobus sp.]